jgi:hypothetical protein
MNILHEKRRALGYMAMGGEGSGGGGGGNAPDFSGLDASLGEAMGASAAANSAPSSAPDAASVNAAVDAALSAGKPGESDMANAAAGLASSYAAPASVADTPGLSTRGFSLSALANPTTDSMTQEFSMPEVTSTPESIAANKATYAAQNFPNAVATDFSTPSTVNTKPGEDFMSRYSATETFNDLTPAENLAMARALQLPANDIYTYDFNEPGFREAVTRATMFDSDSLGYRMGLRGMGVTSDQFLSGIEMGGETEAEKADRMGLVNSGLQTLADIGLALVPGGALLSTINSLASGKSTMGGFLSNLAMTVAGKSLGVAPSVLSNMLEGNLGGAAKSMALGALNNSISKSTGLPAAVTAAIGKSSGATDAVGNAISSAVNGVTGNTSTGFSTKGLASAIDSSLGSFGYTGGPISGSAFGNVSPGSQNTVNTLSPVDSMLNGGSNTPASPASTPSSTNTSTPASTSAPTSTSNYSTSSPATYSGLSAVPVNIGSNAADIGYYYDLAGSDIFAPKKAGTERPDIIKYLQNNVATAAQGGSIEDLLNYVRK